MTFPAHAASSDLAVESIWLEDASQIGQPVSQLSPGQSFNIIATIKNIGQDTASNYYLDVYYDSDYGRGGPDNIAAGEVQTWYVGPLTAQAGTHTTKWVVDPDNQIAELDETNNQKELTFTVGTQTVTTTVTSSSTSSTTQLTSTSTSSTSESTSTSTSYTTESTSSELTSASTTTMTSSTSSTTESTQTFTVTFYTDPGNGVVTADGITKTDQTTGIYSGGQRVHLLANPMSGYSFTSWETSGLSVDDQYASDTHMTVTSDGSLKAHFTAVKYTVTVFTTKTDGSALGGVQVIFGSETKTTDSAGKAEFLIPAGSYNLGVQSPIAGDSGIQYVFTQFTDGVTQNPRSIAVSASVTYEIKYKTQYQLTMQVDPSGTAGTSPGVGVWWYDAGQTVSIQASPASGYSFQSWAGSGAGSYTGTANPASVTMNEPLSETATLASSAIITGRIVSVSDSPDPVARRRTVNFSITIKNTGNIVWSSATITIKIYRPDGALVATPALTVKGIQPGGQYSYRISWRVPYNAPRGIWHYKVYVNYAGVFIASSTDPANTITVR